MDTELVTYRESKKISVDSKLLNCVHHGCHTIFKSVVFLCFKIEKFLGVGRIRKKPLLYSI